MRSARLLPISVKTICAPTMWSAASASSCARRQPRPSPWMSMPRCWTRCEVVAGDARRRRVHLRTELGQGLPPVLADQIQLQQVLINLLVNGMDATDGASGAAHELTVRTGSNDNSCVEIAITDRGCGIAPDHTQRLFNAFFTTKKEGMGLGLSIARSIVTAHHGRIWADNNADGGATFHVSIPAAQNRQRA